MTDAHTLDAPPRATITAGLPDHVRHALWLAWWRTGPVPMSYGDLAAYEGVSPGEAERGVQAALHDEWAATWRRGESLAAIAARFAVEWGREEYTPDDVRRGVQAALRRAGKLAETDAPTPVPRFDLFSSWGSSCKAKPTCEDIHPGGPIPAGSIMCCESCGQSGMDGHPSLQLRPADVE